jgi:hypothetical protein
MPHALDFAGSSQPLCHVCLSPTLIANQEASAFTREVPLMQLAILLSVSLILGMAEDDETLRLTNR